jgi:hypothetical protein
MRAAVAVVTVLLIVSPALAQQRLYDFPMDTDPGWIAQGLWEFGGPQGLAGDIGSPDPASGFTGQNVYGYNLVGGYEDDLTETMWLTTMPLDFTGVGDVHFYYQRWVGVGAFCDDQVWIEASNDGENWVQLWHNPDG